VLESATGSGDQQGNDGASVRGPQPGVLRNREDAIAQLLTVAAYVEKTEPTNPAPLLIRRAQRLMGKNFMDIIRDLASDGLGQVERIAGSPDQ
jgi:type VI secretion system protein ImpA